MPVISVRISSSRSSSSMTASRSIRSLRRLVMAERVAVRCALARSLFISPSSCSLYSLISADLAALSSAIWSSRSSMALANCFRVKVITLSLFLLRAWPCSPQQRQTSAGMPAPAQWSRSTHDRDCLSGTRRRSAGTGALPEGGPCLHGPREIAQRQCREYRGGALCWRWSQERLHVYRGADLLSGGRLPIHKFTVGSGRVENVAKAGASLALDCHERADEQQKALILPGVLHRNFELWDGLIKRQPAGNQNVVWDVAHAATRAGFRFRKSATFLYVLIWIELPSRSRWTNLPSFTARRPNVVSSIP